MKNKKQCCKLNDHAYCEFCGKKLHDNQIDYKGCDKLGLIESACKKCIFEFENPFKSFFNIKI